MTITITEAAFGTEGYQFPWRATDHCGDDRNRRWFNQEVKTKGSNK